MKYWFTTVLSLLLYVAVYAQGFTLTGKVTHRNTGVPLAGVKVIEQGTLNETLTGNDGQYSLELKDGYETVLFIYPNFNTKKVLLTGSNSLDLQLSPATSGDNINVGFGSQTRSELTSSVSSVSSGEISNQPVIDVEQASQGRAAGVFIQNNGGKLGEGTTVRIRGGSSLSASNEPLYVVDGVPLTSGNQSNINPSDIESMEILKDASAAAIYGSRAANGVVLITTKSGTSGKMKIDVDYQLGISETPKKLDLYSATDYKGQLLEYGLRQLPPQLAAIAFFDSTAAAALAEVEAILDETSAENLNQWVTDNRITLSDGTSYDLSQNQYGTNDFLRPMSAALDSNVYDTDWQDEVFRQALSHRASINLSGGSEALQYFTGLSYTNQEGILIGNEFERFNGRLNLKSQVSDKVSINTNLSYARINNDALNDDADLGSPLQAIVLPPSDGYDPDNNYRLFVRSNEYNPLTEINFATNYQKSDQFIGNLGAQFDLTDKLRLNVEGGIDYDDSEFRRKQGPETLDGAPTGLTSIRTSQTLNSLGTGYFTYSGLSGLNNWSAVLGASYQRSGTEFSFTQLRSDSFAELENATSDDDDFTDLIIPDAGYVLVSNFARINYSISNKYVFQASARLDGSSRFGTNNRYGIFPAGSVGWNISNESFLQNNSAISFLKLKASYGLVGNTPDEDFLYARNYFQVLYGAETGIRINNLENPDLKWETTSQLDIGLDYGFVDDRITGSVNYYYKQTTDLLFPRPISLTSGLSSSLQNVGTLENRGLEFAISSVNVSTGNFQWTTDFNIATNTNEVTDLGGDDLVVGVNAYLEGEAPGSFYMPEYVGVNPQTGEALYKDGFGGTTPDYEFALEFGRQIVGNPNPDFFGGLANTLTYGNFSLNFLFQFVQGNEVYFATGEFLSNSGILNLGQTKDQLDRWYKPGDDAAYPVVDPFQDQTFPSSRWIQDGSYIRLNNLSLTYNFSQEALSRMGLRHLSVYVGGQNLITFTNYEGYDPDVAYVDPQAGTIGQNISRGNDYFTTPQARIYTVGVKFGL